MMEIDSKDSPDPSAMHSKWPAAPTKPCSTTAENPACTPAAAGCSMLSSEGSEAMTERDWEEATDPSPMLRWLRNRASDRKLRLFACACVRRVAHLLEDERSRRALEVAERFAEGLANEADLRAAADAADSAANIAMTSAHPTATA